MDKRIYLNNLGAELSSSGDISGAEEVLRKALEEFTGDPLLHYNLGLVLLRKGEEKEALWNFRQAVSMSLSPGGGAADADAFADASKGTSSSSPAPVPRSAIASDCALACYEASLYEEADHFYLEAEKAGASGSEFRNRRGVLFFVTGKYEKAWENFEKAVSDDPMNADAWYNLADTYEALGLAGETDRARKKYLELERQAGSNG